MSYALLSGCVTHCNGRVNWVVVCRDVLHGAQVEGWTEVEDACLHFEPIGVSVESVVCIEHVTMLVLKHLPVDDEVLTLIVSSDRNSIKLNIELNEIFKVWRMSNLYNDLVTIQSTVSS